MFDSISSLNELDFANVFADAQKLDLMPLEEAKVESVDDQRMQKPISSAQAQMLANLKVQISLEVGTLEMSVDELIDLLPGQIFQYALPSEQVVSLKLGGTKVAEAKLVCQDEKLGLKIINVCDSR